MNDTDAMGRPDRDVERVSNAAAALAEHFDSVQIIATRCDDGCTSMTHAGKGNWYAREASLREYLLKQDERSRESIRHEND